MEYVTWLEQAGIQASMSAKGNPYDNAKAESFTVAEAEAHLGHFIEAVYNAKQLHSSLGYLPPLEFEAAYFSSLAEATYSVVR